MSQPRRYQLSRRKGYRKPEGAVVVSRPSKYANPFTVAQYGREGAVDRFEKFVATDPAFRAMIRRELRGKDVACWCGLDELCHADVLLRVAASEAEQ